MKSIYRIFLLSLLSGLTIVSCKEDEVKEDTVDMMSFAPSDVIETRSLINSNLFQTVGNEVSVIDFYRPQGASTWYEYVNNTITCPGSGSAWSYKYGINYYWTLSGTHKAFGWLEKDAVSGITSSQFFDGLSYSNKLLSIPERSITAASEDQYDFMYSLLSTRELPGTEMNDYSPIPLEMWHLFTAIGIGIKNATKVDVTIKSLTVQNLTNVKSATVDWSDFVAGHDVDVKYYAAAANSTTKDLGLKYTGEEFTLAPGTSVKDVLTSTTGGNNSNSYFLMWPQTVAELTPANDFNVDDAGNYIENDTDPLIIIEYITNGTTVKRALRFAENTVLQAGYRYHFDIVFAEKMVELITTVKPWNYSSININFDDAAVSVKEGGVLTPTPGSYTPGAGRKLYIKNGQGVNFTFTLDAPVGGTWRVSLEKDREYFNVSPTTGTVNSQQASFTVTPVGGNAERDYSVTIKIVVIRADGTTVNADVLQEVDNVYTPYEIIWQKN